MKTKIFNIGNHYINPEKIDYVEESDESIFIHFESGAHLTLENDFAGKIFMRMLRKHFKVME